MDHNELPMRAGVFVSKILDSQCNAHAFRIRAAGLAIKALEDFIYNEVSEAQSHPRTSDLYVSFGSIGKALEVSRSAAYARYGPGRKRNSDG